MGRKLQGTHKGNPKCTEGFRIVGQKINGMNWDDTNKMFVKIPIPALILFKLSLNQPLNKS